jgi:hypothetical protein
MPGARPKGNLPRNAIARHPMIAASVVEVNTAPLGIPSKSPNIVGFTARIYDMVRNVVIPATISRRMVVFVWSKPKSLFNILYLIYRLSLNLSYKGRVGGTAFDLLIAY